MLQIALPNKGSLSEASVSMLSEAGYRCKRRGRELVIEDLDNDVRIFFLRPRDIAVYVGAGHVHAGITGRDLLLDSETEAIEYEPLGFGRSQFRFAGPVGQFSSIADIEGKRVAASYDHLVNNFLKDRGVSATVVHLDGAVESSVQLGVADLIADVVETGSTLRAAGLEIFGDPILSSEAVLITTQTHVDHPALRVLSRRLQGVLIARRHVLVDYNLKANDLSLAVKIAPGFESPTVSPLADPDWLAVRVVVERDQVNKVMDQLLGIGAQGIIVTELASSRLA